MKRRAKSYLSLSPRPLPAEVERKDLLNRITHASEVSLLVLAAPSGYGKTTLLGQLARAADHPAWLTLSERHTDLTTLADELMTSVAQVAKDADFTHIRKAISEGAQVSALSVPLAKALDALGVNLHILVDQANLLGDGRVTWLESFALALGEGHRLSYGAYDLSSERLAVPLASGRALLLTATDLAFSEEESRAYLAARGSTQDAADVQRALEGWPAGIGLAAAEVGHIVSPDNLLETVFNRLSEEVRGALPEASVLEVWREADAEKLGCKLPKGWLGEAQRSGLPLTPLSTKTYRPHTLVAEMLERELQNRPKRYAELHTLAGDEARKNEDLVAALQHYRKAGRLSEAFEVAEELIPQLNDRQEFKLVCELLEPLLPTVERFPPEVFAYYGHALFSTGQLKRSERVFQDLQASEQGEPLTSIFLADVLYEQRRYAKMYETICRVVTQANKSAHFYTAQRMLVRALTELGRHDKALALIQNVIARAETEENQLQLASALLSLEVLYFRTGDYAACERTILKALVQVQADRIG